MGNRHTLDTCECRRCKTAHWISNELGFKHQPYWSLQHLQFQYSPIGQDTLTEVQVYFPPVEETELIVATLFIFYSRIRSNGSDLVKSKGDHFKGTLAELAQLIKSHLYSNPPNE